MLLLKVLQSTACMSDKLGKNDNAQHIIYGNAIQFFLASKQHEQARKYLR
jgi:hypothetical protein